MNFQDRYYPMTLENELISYYCRSGSFYYYFCFVIEKCAFWHHKFFCQKQFLITCLLTFQCKSQSFSFNEAPQLISVTFSCLQLSVKNIRQFHHAETALRYLEFFWADRYTYWIHKDTTIAGAKWRNFQIFSL